jgi:predicted transposase YdaD
VAVNAEVKAAVDAAVEAAVEAAKKEAEERGEKLGRLEGRAIEIIESGYENGLSDSDILEKLCRKLNISDDEAQGYLEKYKNSEWE